MYELVVVWMDGNSKKEVYQYNTREKAEQAMDGYMKAFGRQVWCCVREKMYL